MGTERPGVLELAGADGVSKTFRLREGVTVVGRSTDCTIVIDDPSLSRRHFEIACDANGCHLRDLRSRNGVLVNGQVMRAATLKVGDRINAGAATFDVGAARERLSASRADAQDRAPDGPDEQGPPTLALAHPIFSSTEPSLPSEAPSPPPETLLAALTTNLGTEPGVRLYAVVDGAAAFDLAFTARLMGHELFTLFLGPLADAAAHVGPCLVAIGEPSAFLKAWVDRIGAHAGVLLETPARAEALCAHLRHLFIASDETGQEYFFRFYDPRVLRVFLPTCHPQELREFFGPVVRWIAEDADGKGFDIGTLREGQLERTSVSASGVQTPA